MLRLRHLFPLAALALACTRTNADILRLDPTLRPPTNPDSIQVLGQEPSRSFTVIAIVAAQPSSMSVADIDQIRARLIKEAARLGGHAILFDTGSLTRVGGDESERQQLSGKVIVYTESTPPR